jgi:hypothetical protein
MGALLKVQTSPPGRIVGHGRERERLGERERDKARIGCHDEES